MEIKVEQKGEITILYFRNNIAESDIPLFESTLSTMLSKSSKIIVSMTGTRSAEAAEWQIANALCNLATEATKQGKKIAIACLPSEILYKANQLKLDAKARVFCQENPAVTFLVDADIAA